MSDVGVLMEQECTPVNVHLASLDSIVKQTSMSVNRIPVEMVLLVQTR